jgi:hypothetical protein
VDVGRMETSVKVVASATTAVTSEKEQLAQDKR